MVQNITNVRLPDASSGVILLQHQKRVHERPPNSNEAEKEGRSDVQAAPTIGQLESREAKQTSLSRVAIVGSRTNDYSNTRLRGAGSA